MKTNRNFLILPLILAVLTAGTVLGQSALRGLHGSILNDKNGLHAGNKLHLTIYNDGTAGTVSGAPSGRDRLGTWPDDIYGLRHIYIIDGNIFIASEVIDNQGRLQHIHSTCRSAGGVGAYSSGDASPSGEWWTFLALPGFASPDTDKIAMNKWKFSWPQGGWPDKSDDPVDPGWIGKWNGYFGKDILNADEESFYVADDWNNKEFDFYPDSLDHDRKGLGIRVWARGFQWANALVDDDIFLLYDFENIGTYMHDKVVFGYKIGNNMGDYTGGGDGADDGGAYDLQEQIAWQFDVDNISSGGAGEWPNGVGLIGAAFMESPGNAWDGIDNDRDGAMGSGLVISEDTWAPKVLRKGDKIVVTDYTDYSRVVKTFGTETHDGTGMHPKLTLDTLYIHYQDQVYKYYDGKELAEYENNLIDDNLNGIIDENNGFVYGKDPATQIRRFLYIGLKYKDHITGEGTDNPMIDESRDDGLDDNNNWFSKTDDVGQDGVPFTSDPGERDGKPTLGEPHFDKTDIGESDMIGLTAFSLYKWEGFYQFDDEGEWNKMRPGNLDDVMQNDNVENMWASGYFPLPPGVTQRFSMCIIMAFTKEELFDNNRWAVKAYGENYNFTKAPNIPTVTAVTGDNKVTLFWDDFAEKSKDPITGSDFEGYRIYRSTDPGFSDMASITDGKGNSTYRKPVVQFDLVNGIKGYAQVPMPGMGIQFFLGDETGLTHIWTDTTAKNGFTYYYAVASYDRGDQMTTDQIAQYQKDHGGLSPNPPTIPPSECTKTIIVLPGQDIPTLGSNVVMVRPEAPSAGLKAAFLDNMKKMPGSTATGNIGYKVINPDAIRDGHKYRMTFEDSLVTVSPITRVTKNFTMADVTDEQNPDTLIKKSKFVTATDEQPLTDGFQLIMLNEATLTLDAARSEWNRPGILGFLLAGFSYGKTKGNPEAADYRIEFGQAGMDTARPFLRGTTEIPGTPVNFTVYKLYPSDTGEVSVKSKFGLYKMDAKALTSQFSAFTSKSMVSDQIIMMNDAGVPGFMFQLDKASFDSIKTLPQPGDYVTIRLRKPFLSNDAVEFVTRKARVDDEQAKQDLDKIKVVPNPYVVANSFEPLNPYTNGRGPREIHFTHLPTKCTIKIFNVRGQPVATLEHDSQSLADGTEIWNMLTKDQLDIAYGVYVFHVDAGKLGTKTGKFAVIK